MMKLLSSNYSTIFPEHSNSLTNQTEWHPSDGCDSSQANCHGYIRKMITFYKTTGGWIMLGIVLCGIGCLVFTFIQNFLAKKPGMSGMMRKPPIRWRRKDDTATREPKNAPVRKTNIINGFIGQNGLSKVRHSLPCDNNCDENQVLM